MNLKVMIVMASTSITFIFNHQIASTSYQNRYHSTNSANTSNIKTNQPCGNEKNLCKSMLTKSNYLARLGCPLITTNCEYPTSLNFPINKLQLIGSYSHGAPIQSVAWSTIAEDSSLILAAAGGYAHRANPHSHPSLRVYSFNYSTEQLEPIFDDQPTDYVYSVAWCTINSIPHLAVAGDSNNEKNVWIYKYNADHNTMDLIASLDNHKTIVYTVAWLCDACSPDKNIRFLAIGGEPQNDVDIQILKWNSETKTLSSINSAPFGATVYALDWCKGTNAAYHLVAAGQTTVINNKSANIKIYNFSCDGTLTLVNSIHQSGSTMRAAKWYYTNNPKIQIFAVGGDPLLYGSDGYRNITFYVYDSSLDKIKPIAVHAQPGKVLALNWVTGYDSVDIIAGSVCINGASHQNIFVYNINPHLLPKVDIVNSTHFDHAVTSLASIKIGNTTFVLAGSENIMPLKEGTEYWNSRCQELALYKAVFCQPQCKPFKPDSIFKRNKLTTISSQIH